MPGLKQREATIPYTGGVETKVDPKVAPPVKLSLLENGSFDTPGRIQKRNGYTKNDFGVIDAPSATLTGANLYAKGSQIYLHADQEDVGWQVFSGDKKASTWHPIGDSLPGKLSIQQTGVNEKAEYAPINSVIDVAVCNGYTIVVFTSTGQLVTGNVRYSIVENETGQVVIDDNYLKLGVTLPCGLRLVAVGTSVHVYMAGSSGGDKKLYQAIIDTTDLSTAPTSMTALIDIKNPWFDAVYSDHSTYGDCAAVAMRLDSDGFARVKWYDESGTEQDEYATSTALIDCPLCIARVYDADTTSYRLSVCCRLAADSSFYMLLLNEDSTLNGTRVIATAGESWAANECLSITVAEDPLANTSNACMRVFVTELRPFVTADTSTSHTEIHVHSVRFDTDSHTVDPSVYFSALASKAFVVGQKAHVWTSANVFTHQSHLALRSFRGSVICFDARLLPSRNGISKTCITLPYVTNSSGVYAFGAIKKGRLLSDFSDLGSFLFATIAKLDTTDKVSDLIDEKGGGLCTGPVVGSLGDSFVDHGICQAPDRLAYEHYATGGVFSDGDVKFVVVYEWYNSDGELVRSMPSEPITATFNKGGSVQWVKIYAPFYRIKSPKKSNYNMTCYQLCSDGNYHLVASWNNGGSTYRLGIFSIGLTGSNPDPIDNEMLYTTGGIIENVAPPASHIIITDNDRCYLVPDEDPEAIWVSKPKAEGVAYDFAEDLIKYVRTGGPINALGAMDGNIYAFKNPGIRVLPSTGPNALGVGVFGVDRPIAWDEGTAEQASVITTDIGIIFKSTKGFYILLRTQQAVYIGSAVADWDQYTVVDSKLLEDRHQARFVMSNGDCLVYDYLVKQWSVFTNHTAVDAVVCAGKYNLLKSNGDFHVESAGFYDDTTAITLKLATNWIKRAGFHGCQRIWWIYLEREVKSDHDLIIELAYDYDDTVVETFTLSGDEKRLMPGRQMCEAIKITIYDSNQSGSGESLNHTALTFVYGVKPGKTKYRPELTV